MLRRAAGPLLACLCVDLATSVVLNTRVLTDRVYVLILGLETGDPLMEQVVDAVRQWRVASYVVSPFVLAGRVVGAALLVQLLLMGLRVRSPLQPVIVAASWAQLPLAGARALRAIKLALLPAADRTGAALAEPIGSLSSFLGLRGSQELLSSFLHRVTAFDLAWCVVFAAALRDREKRRAPVVGTAVVGAALIFAGLRWAGWLYLTGIPGISVAP